jgi:hypothetical protein
MPQPKVNAKTDSTIHQSGAGEIGYSGVNTTGGMMKIAAITA